MLPQTKFSLFTGQKCKSEDAFERCEQRSKQRGRKEQESEQKQTVIVNIVIVIGSNNHILISCECVFYPNSGWLQTKKTGKRMFSIDWNVHPTNL